jgi:hypothetical protein
MMGLRFQRVTPIVSHELTRPADTGVTHGHSLWSAKLSLAYPHLRLFEALELPIDLVQIKGLWIKLATDPFQQLLMLGVLRILYSVQKARVTPDATAILGRTGAFAREAHWVVLGLNIARLSFGATAARHDGEAIVNHPRNLETAVVRVLYIVRCVGYCDAPDTVGWRAYPYSCSPGKIRTRAVTYADGPERVRRP